MGLFGIQEDHKEASLSLDEKLVPNKTSTFFFVASSKAMEPIIFPGDILIVDRSLEALSGMILLVEQDAEFLCRRLVYEKNKMILRSENGISKDIQVSERVTIFGVVRAIARDDLHLV